MNDVVTVYPQSWSGRAFAVCMCVYPCVYPCVRLQWCLMECADIVTEHCLHLRLHLPFEKGFMVLDCSMSIQINHQASGRFITDSKYCPLTGPPAFLRVWTDAEMRGSKTATKKILHIASPSLHLFLWFCYFVCCQTELNSMLYLCQTWKFPTEQPTSQVCLDQTVFTISLSHSAYVSLIFLSHFTDGSTYSVYCSFVCANTLNSYTHMHACIHPHMALRGTFCLLFYCINPLMQCSISKIQRVPIIPNPVITVTAFFTFLHDINKFSVKMV